jgi:C-terminal processing protease CtpA/Prc
MSFPTEPQRRAVFDKILQLIAAKFAGPDPDIDKLRAEHEAGIVRSATAQSFEESIDALLRALGTSHTGFFHESRPRATGRIAMAATLMKANTPDGARWVFQDVHPGGVAATAGIAPGDVLIAIDGKEVVPPTAIPFQLGQSYDLTVRKADGTTAEATLAIPGSREKKRPIVVPDQVVTARKLDTDVGYVRVSMFPGVLGIDVARDMTRAIADLACPRLVIDLRGNTGGGIGCLRLMSHLCADRRGVGYSVTRDVAKKGYDKERLPQFDGIPSSKWGILPLALKFGFAGRSVAVFTEALGPKVFHGRVAMLVNEHSASAAEMVAAFASEYRLATLVGTKTAGRLVATGVFKVGFGYRLALPVAKYYTWHGTDMEGRGVEPDVLVAADAEGLRGGDDRQLSDALLATTSGEGGA